MSKCIIKAAVLNYLMEKMGIPKESHKVFLKEMRKFLIFFTFILFLIITNSLIRLSEMQSSLSHVDAIFVLSYPIIVMFVVDSSFISIIGKVNYYLIYSKLILNNFDFIESTFIFDYNRYANHKFIKLNELLKSLSTSTRDLPQHKRTMKEFTYREENPKFQYLKSVRKDYTSIIKSAKYACIPKALSKFTKFLTKF